MEKQNKYTPVKIGNVPNKCESCDMFDECFIIGKGVQRFCDKEEGNIVYKYSPQIHLTFLGVDSWNRPVYKDQHGRLWKNTNIKPNGNASYHTSYNNDFEGEPDTPMKVIYPYCTVDIKGV